MKSILLAMIAWLFFAQSAKSQNETNNWYFGIFAGVTFSTGSPVAVTNSSIYTTEGCAAISDTAGNLLFYTDGTTVYNSAHAVMPNGTGLMGDISTTQSALIIKQPLSDSLYYLFTVAADGGPAGLRYSIIDMSLQGGLGDVTATKNIFLLDHVTEKLCGVNASDDVNAWVMVHGFGDDKFYSYQVTPTGLITTPTVSVAGSIHDSTQIQNSYGYMKFSPEGNKVAVAMGYLDKAEVFDFDNQDGIVHTPLTIPLNEHCYGVEFSPNSNMLYLTHYSNLTQVFTLDQMDLNAGSPAAVLASRTTVSLTNDPDEMRALQLGKDGKIYIARSLAGFLDVINSPDLPGALCYYQLAAVSLAGNTCFAGLPNFNSSYLREIQAPSGGIAASDSTLCANGCDYFTDASLNHPTSWQWSFPGGTPATAFVKNPGPVCYGTSGNYDVTLIVSNSMGSDTFTASNFITVLPQPAQPVISVAGDVLTSSAATTYQWYFNSSPISGATSQSYTATQSGNYMVTITDTSGCSNSSVVTNITVSSVTGLDIRPIDVYPNPARDYCIISDNRLKAVRGVTVTDQLGRKMYVPLEEMKDGWRLSLAKLSPGLYTVLLDSDRGVVYRTRLSVIK